MLGATRSILIAGRQGLPRPPRGSAPCPTGTCTAHGTGRGASQTPYRGETKAYKRTKRRRGGFPACTRRSLTCSIRAMSEQPTKRKAKDAERAKETDPRPTGHRDGVAVLVPWQVLPLARVVELAL